MSVFRDPRNQEIVDLYLQYNKENPQWEPLGMVNKIGGKTTVTIDGVSYYQPRSYNAMPYYHLNEQKGGAKKSSLAKDIASEALNILIPKAAMAIGAIAPVALGAPALAPAGMVTGEILGKAIRRQVKQKTGFGDVGVYKEKQDNKKSKIIKNKVVNKVVNKEIKKNKQSNPWIEKVKKYQVENGVSYKQALQELKNKK